MNPETTPREQKKTAFVGNQRRIRHPTFRLPGIRFRGRRMSLIARWRMLP